MKHVTDEIDENPSVALNTFIYESLIQFSLFTTLLLLIKI